jgi:Carboxypeptidase regulatory-like domain
MRLLCSSLVRRCRLTADKSGARRYGASILLSALVASLLGVGIAPAIAAQGTTGTVEGTATTEEDNSPIQFALVRLVPINPQVGVGQQGITNASGQFHFVAVPVGEYRLELLRIGYRPVRSPALQIRAGETLTHGFRGSMVGLPLPTVMVYPPGACLQDAQLNADARLRSLWEEISNGVATRRAFDQRFYYTYSLRQTSETSRPSWPVVPSERTDTVANEPDSVLVRDEQRRALQQAEGYGNGSRFILPDERELIEDAFLQEHCIVPVLQEADGMTGLPFRQTKKRRDAFGLQGTIWVDANTRLMRKLELEYLNGDTRISEITIDYADFPVENGALRLPSSGRYSLRPPRASRGTFATGTLKYSYWGFRELSSKSN